MAGEEQPNTLVTGNGDEQKGPIFEPWGELEGFITTSFPATKIGDVALPQNPVASIEKVLRRYRWVPRPPSERPIVSELDEFDWEAPPRRKVLVTGPPRYFETTAEVLAGELELPLFTVWLEGLITDSGDAASKLQIIFDSMSKRRGVYFFNQFDLIGSQRDPEFSVGEMSLIQGTFLQQLKEESSLNLIVVARNRAPSSSWWDVLGGWIENQDAVHRCGCSRHIYSASEMFSAANAK